MEHNLTRYTVTVEGCPFAAQYDSNLMGCMIAEYNFAGDRFVATKPYKDLRYPATSPMTASLPYLALKASTNFLLFSLSSDWKYFIAE